MKTVLKSIALLLAVLVPGIALTMFINYVQCVGKWEYSEYPFVWSPTGGCLVMVGTRLVPSSSVQVKP